VVRTSRRDASRVIQGQKLKYTVTRPGGWKEAGKSDLFDSLFQSPEDVTFMGVIADDVECSTSYVADFAKRNLPSYGSDAPMIYDQKQVEINGYTWSSFKATVVKGDIIFHFIFFVHGGKEGAFQIVGYTPDGRFEQHLPDFQRFAESFTFPDSSAPHL
jgi:hypothetical protein